MTKRSTVKITAAVAITLLAIILLLSGYATEEAHGRRPQDSLTVSLMQDSGEQTVIASNGACDYKIFFSAGDAIQSDQVLAKDISTLIYEMYGIRVAYKADSAVRATDKEILIGTTNRSESKALAAALQTLKTADDDLVWGYCMMNGKLLYTASDGIAFEYGMTEFVTYLAENSFTVPSDLSVLKVKSRAEYDAEIKEKEELERQEVLEELRAMNSAFTQEQFGGDPKSMGESPYDSPLLYPASGMHPRIFITADKLDDVRAIMEDPAYAKLVKTFYNDVNMDREKCIGGFPTVYFDDPDDLYEDDYYRYDVSIISALQNKAFAYFITGDEVYGYEAIIGAKNMILTLKYSTYIHMDLYHGASHVMIAVAKIYDWCYGLMTEDDKMQIAAGISNIIGPQMESGMRFPPSGMNAVSGHGTGPQLLRDWIMICIALYDEMPDWWEYVGGRYFQEYVPVINEHTKNGWVTQGTSCYGPSKFSELMISARLLYLSTGQLPYDTEGIRLAPYYVISHLQANGKYFQTGDGARNPSGGSLQYSYLYDVAAIFGDSVLTGYLYSITDRMNNAAKPDWDNDAPAAKILAYLAYLPDPEPDALESIDTIQYFEHPAGSMTARTSWDSDAAVFFMRIGTMTMANHDILDSGTFQIYYKGLLAGSTGTYNKYGSNVHKYYLQSTVAQNGLLVFNPAYASAEPRLGTDSDGNADPLNVLNGASYFYSGGQKRLSEAGTLENWLGGNYRMGTVTGVDKGYSYADGSAEYAYIAGDITDAYDSATVEYIERRMLTVFTGDPDLPALFFTFDTMEAKQASFAKTFLLHTVNEPTVDTDGMTADIRAGEGRLYVQSLFGADKIEKIGGSGYAYWINGYYNSEGTWIEGKNCVDQYCPTDNADRFWGRIQLTASGEALTQMLTAMYVTDSSSTETAAFEKFSNDRIFGAKFKNIYAIFTASREREYKQFSFVTEGTGLSNYYISGLEAGTWSVLVDGVRVASVNVSEDGGFASFIAPSGTVSLEPTENVLGATGGRIQYTTGGGLLGDDAQYTYHNDTATPITQNITRGTDKFLGWYTTPTFDKGTEITEIPAGTTGTVKVYAKWLSTYVNETYEGTVINNKEANSSKNNINYNGSGKAGSSFVTKTDDSGSYLVWTKGSSDSFMSVKNTENNFSILSADDETVSFEFKIAKDGDNPILPFNLRIMSNVEYKTNADRVWGEMPLFSVKSDGTVCLGSSGSVIGSIADGSVLNIRVAVDFKNECIKVYNDLGAKTVSMDITPPSGSGAPNCSEWRKLMKEYLAYIYPNPSGKADSSIRIYGFKISEGNVLENTELKDRMIDYNLAGGSLASDAPFYYSTEEDTLLPEATKSGAEFGGWYSTPDFKEGTEITHVSKDSEGPVKVYAKWLMTFVDTDFSGSSVNADENENDVLGLITFHTKGKTGAKAVTKYDENGKPYVEFVKGSSDSFISVKSTENNFSTMATGLVSYSFAFSKKAGCDVFASSNIVLESNYSAEGTEGVWGALSLFSIKSDGTVLAPDGSDITKIVEGDIAYVNFTVDFINGALTYYSADGSVATTVSFTAPAKSGAASTAEWQRLIKLYMLYFRANDNTVSADSTINIHAIKIKEGNIFDTVEAPDGNSITYRTGGGTLPPNAPGTYDAEKETVLPTEVTREGYIFAGWYTDSGCTGTRIYSIPAGGTKCITLYAKWSSVFVDADFSGNDVNATVNSNDSYGDLYFITQGKSGASFVTKTDEDGRKYLEWTKGSSDSLLRVSDVTPNFSTMASTAASYSFKLKKSSDAPLLYTPEIILESNVNTSGTTAWGTLKLFAIKENGDIVCPLDESIVIATLSDSSVTDIRFTVDFARGQLIFYSEDNTVLHTFGFTAPEVSGAATTAEWQRLIKRYMLYFRASDNTAPADSKLLIYGITIAEGNIYA